MLQVTDKTDRLIMQYRKQCKLLYQVKQQYNWQMQNTVLEFKFPIFFISTFMCIDAVPNVPHTFQVMSKYQILLKIHRVLQIFKVTIIQTLLTRSISDTMNFFLHNYLDGSQKEIKRWGHAKKNVLMYVITHLFHIFSCMKMVHFSVINLLLNFIQQILRDPAYKHTHAQINNRWQINNQITYRLTKIRIGSVINLLVISKISCGNVADINTT